MATPVRKYNPGFLTDDELVASFCIRTTEFEMLVEALRDCTGPSNQHQIVIGPRGSGKTTLLLRVAAEARRDPALAAHCFPIVFAEESYEVSTAGEFWLECLTLLAAQAPRPENEPDLHRTVEDLRPIRDDRSLADRCLGALLDFADRHDQRLLLLVENLNMLFRDMMDQAAGWRLRKTLQTEPRIILFASATSRFQEIDHPERALYDLFRVRTLRPLDTAACEILWKAVTGCTPPTPTIRSLEILTGGNPRLLAIVARFGAARSFRQLMADLLDLVDDHTEYFKSHLDSLAAQERRVYLALAALWKPATTREIADQARLDTNTCSAQLARLGAHGAVQVTGGSTRRKQYYLTERLYNIYYLLRRHRGPDRLVEALIHFMESYYSPRELKEIAVSESRRAAEDPDDLMQLLYQSALKKLLASPILSQYHGGLETQNLRADADPDEQLANEMLDQLELLLADNRFEAALTTCEETEHRFGESDNPAVAQVVASVLVNKGAVLDELNRPLQALDAYDHMLGRFGKSETSTILPSVANALANKVAVLGRLSRPQEALDVCDYMLGRFGKSKISTILPSVASALVNKGAALDMLGRPQEALDTCDEMVRRFDGNETEDIHQSVGMALVNKGAALGGLNRPEDVLTACDQAIEHFGQNETLNTLPSLATAFMNKGVALKVLNREREALDEYGKVIDLFTKGELSKSSRVGVVAMRALLQRAATALATGDQPACERDIRDALSLLPQGDFLSQKSITALVKLNVDLGPQRMSELIQESPAADLLLPLTTALERELGNEPRVAREVEEVAQDIRQQLKNLREGP